MKLIQTAAFCILTSSGVMLLGCAPDTEEKTVTIETTFTPDSSKGVLSDAQERTLKKAHETEEVLKDVEKKRLDTLNDAE